MAPKQLTILGATGSIGSNTLDIVRQFPGNFRVFALSCQSRLEMLLPQIAEFSPEWVCVGTEAQAHQLLQEHPHLSCRLTWGEAGLIQIARAPEVDLVVSGIVGAAGLRPTYAAIEAGKPVALANKETMVLAGELMMAKARETGSVILPMDSEHNAIFQSLVGHRQEDIEALILTGSGGPFRDRPLAEFPSITLAEALQHPNWKMGNKITIDSATMMNKGLEIIEARWLFDLPVEQIEVVIHRQSIVHSLVQYCDGSFVAQLGLPDMRVPIAYCLTYPARLPLKIPKMKLSEVKTLHFEAVSVEKYPCLQLAIDAARLGGGMPATLNGANEEVVEAYLQGRLHFLQISRVLNSVMERARFSLSLPFLQSIGTIEDALAADSWGRQQAQSFLREI